MDETRTTFGKISIVLYDTDVIGSFPTLFSRTHKLLRARNRTKLHPQSVICSVD